MSNYRDNAYEAHKTRLDLWPRLRQGAVVRVTPHDEPIMRTSVVLRRYRRGKRLTLYLRDLTGIFQMDLERARIEILRDAPKGRILDDAQLLGVLYDYLDAS